MWSARSAPNMGLLLEQSVGYLAVVIQHRFFADPVERGHWVTSPASESLPARATARRSNAEIVAARQSLRHMLAQRRHIAGNAAARCSAACPEADRLGARLLSTVSPASPNGRLLPRQVVGLALGNRGTPHDAT